MIEAAEGLLFLVAGSKPKQGESKSVEETKNKSRTKREQTDNKPEQTRKEREGEGEREEESEREGENDMLKILPPGGGNTKSPAAGAFSDVFYLCTG